MQATHSQAQSIENKLTSLSSDIERIEALKQSKQDEAEALKREAVQREVELLELRKQAEKLMEYETKVAFLSSEVKRLTN